MRIRISSKTKQSQTSDVEIILLKMLATVLYIKTVTVWDEYQDIGKWIMRCYTAINKTCLFEKNWISYYASWMSRVTSNYIALSFTLLSNVTLLRYQGFATCLDFIFNKLWSTTHSIIRLTRESLIIKLKIISGFKMIMKWK